MLLRCEEGVLAVNKDLFPELSKIMTRTPNQYHQWLSAQSTNVEENSFCSVSEFWRDLVILEGKDLDDEASECIEGIGHQNEERQSDMKQQAHRIICKNYYKYISSLPKLKAHISFLLIPHNTKFISFIYLIILRSQNVFKFENYIFE